MQVWPQPLRKYPRRGTLWDYEKLKDYLENIWAVPLLSPHKCSESFKKRQLDIYKHFLTRKFDVVKVLRW